MENYYTNRGYVEASSYRVKTIKALGKTNTMTPTNICKDTGIRINHISKTLSELKGHKLIVCLNEEARKGRLYTLTNEGKKIFDDLND